MIIIVRGTNGSGKTHAIRGVFRYMRDRHPERVKEFGTLIYLKNVARPVLVIGPYERMRSMGGCDCIRQPRKIYELIDLAHKNDWHVVMEGVVLAEKPYAQMFKNGRDVRMIGLFLPIKRCLAHIQARQARKGRVNIISRGAMLSKEWKAKQAVFNAKNLGMLTTIFEQRANVTAFIVNWLRHP